MKIVWTRNDSINTLLPDNILNVKLPDDFSNSIGDVRYVYLGDPYPGEVIERLDSFYDDSYLTYSIVDKSCLPMVNYVACVSLKEISFESHIYDVIWGSEDRFTKIKFLELILHKVDSWSWGQ